MATEEEEDYMHLASLKAQPAEMKPVPRGKVRKPNPMAQIVQDSWDQRRPLGIEVDTPREALYAGSKMRKAGMRRFSVSVQYHALPEDEYRSENAVKDMRETDPRHRIRVVCEAHDFDEAMRHESAEDE